MNFLFCCQLYYPSTGGVQTVMRQVAERLVSYGHSVTVATTKLNNRNFSVLNGVQIAEFSAAGSLALGMHGDIEQYREFVGNFPCDAILINAAEQWTFDALIRDLDAIKARKILIPCGFISFYDPAFEQYYFELHEALSKFDSLIFHSINYRDINYAHKHGIDNCVIIPNGASEIEFSGAPDATFRSRHQILENDFLIIAVGAFFTDKGHHQLANAIHYLPENNNRIVAILNGNNPYAEIARNSTKKKIHIMN